MKNTKVFTFTWHLDTGFTRYVVVVILQQQSGKNSSISLNFFHSFNTSTDLKAASYSYNALGIGHLSILLCLVMVAFFKCSLMEKKKEMEKYVSMLWANVRSPQSKLSH